MTKQSAVAYYRTSSAAGVGDDRDSLTRQTAAVEAFAKAHGLEIVRTYYDAAVSGRDPVDQRPGFRAMLEECMRNGATTILVETASRFARDLLVQMTGERVLRDRGLALICVDSPTYFTDDNPTANMIRQILGAVSEFERAMLVERMRRGRERTGRYGGPPRVPSKVKTLARRLRRGRSLRAVSDELAKRGYLTTTGAQYSPSQIKRMVSS